MLCHFRSVHKRGPRTTNAVSRTLLSRQSEFGLGGSLSWNVVFATPPRQHPFWMIGQPVRRIFLSPDQAGERGHVFDRPLLDTRAGRRLETEYEYESGHFGTFGRAAAKIAPRCNAESS